MNNYENVFQSKNTLYERYFDEDKKESVIKKADYKPEIFTRSRNNAPTEYRYLLDETLFLERHVFDDDKEYKDFIKFQDQIGASTYGHIQPSYGYIRQKYYTTQTEFTSRIWYLDIETRVLPDQGFPTADETPSAINMIQIYDSFNKKIIILADEGISDEYHNKLKQKFSNLIFRSFSSEKELFYAFFKLLDNLKPAIITAWNGNGFDFPYITNRAKKMGYGESNLSPVGNASVKEKIQQGSQKEYHTSWDGIYLLDMMDLYKKFTYTTQTSYSLENIIKVELGEGEGKVDYGEFRNISAFMHGNWEKFVEYGIMDVVLLNALDEKLNLIELTRMIAYSSGINVDDALGTVKPWGIYISNQAYLDKLILPNDSGNPEYNGVIGGWVADPKKGKHNWIVSFDFASLYPSIMRWCNMSPETFVTEDKMHDDLKKIRDKILFLDSNFTSNDVNIKSPSPWSSRESYFMKWIDNREILDKVGKILQKHNVSAGINGAFFRNDKLGIVPRLVKELYGQRKKAKKDMFVHSQNIQDLIAKGFSSSSPEIKHEEKMVAFFDTKQMAMKIRLNSLYGALANKHFVLFNEEIAAAITANGRVSNQITAWEISRYTMDNYGYDSMLAGDTDSSYHTLSPIVNQYVKENPNVTKDDIVTFCSDFCEEKLQPVINETLAELSTYLNCYEPEAQAMDREIVADSGFFVAKKKYVARVLDVEGVRLTSPKLKVMGLEIVRSSTPALCRKKLKESIEIILDKEEHEVQEYIKEVKEEFYNAPLEDISRVSGVSKINYDLHTSKSIPINSRASIVHNLLVEKLDLGNSYEPITPADKIKYVMLRTPNPASNQDVVAYKDVRFIEESGLSKYVNRDVMFEKFFMSPMNIMLEPIGWSGEKQPSFDEWE